MRKETDEILRMSGIVKRFPGVVANDHVDLSIARGEIHGLLGENGAGKSTLMKVLYGLYSADEGEILLDGRRLDIDSPAEAVEAGIGMVHQHFMLIPRLSVIENIVLGDRRTGNSPSGPIPDWLPFTGSLRRLTTDRTEARRRIRTLMDKYGLEVDLDAAVWELDVGERQRVEILKALYRDVDLLVLDEPTAVLSPAESTALFETLRQLTAEELTVILITHKLDEAVEYTDRTTVLRDGEVVDVVETDSVSKTDLAEKMVGREVLFQVGDGADTRTGEPVAEVSGLRAEDDRGIEALSGIDLTVHRGEIVGVAGVSGNGQAQLAECLVGMRRSTGGSIRIGGRTLTNELPRAFVEAGVSYIPEDRYEFGCAPDRSVLENAALKDADSFGRILFDRSAARAYAEQLVEEFDVRVPNVDTPAGKLSGGNLQKLICARELSRDPAFLVANQPTRGIDVGAIEYVRQVLVDQCEEGTGILLISEDLDEIVEVSDRIVVMYDGEIVHETDADDADHERIGQYMTGGEAIDASGSSGSDPSADRGAPSVATEVESP